MIRKHYSIKRSELVLSMLLDMHMDHTDLPISEINLSHWSNGREQGFYLCDYVSGRALVFAQQRNSDQIVIIRGDALDFDITTHQPKDALWDTRTYFDTERDAMLSIFNFFQAEELINK